MRPFAKVTLALSVLSGIGVRAQGSGASPFQLGLEEALKSQREQLERMSDFLGPPVSAASTAPPPTITFKNPKAKQFLVEGTKIPNGLLYCFDPD
jgi:hypothetical protein